MRSSLGRAILFGLLVAGVVSVTRPSTAGATVCRDESGHKRPVHRPGDCEKLFALYARDTQIEGAAGTDGEGVNGHARVESDVVQLQLDAFNQELRTHYVAACTAARMDPCGPGMKSLLDANERLPAMYTKLRLELDQAHDDPDRMVSVVQDARDALTKGSEAGDPFDGVAKYLAGATTTPPCDPVRHLKLAAWKSETVPVGSGTWKVTVSAVSTASPSRDDGVGLSWVYDPAHTASCRDAVTGVSDPRGMVSAHSGAFTVVCDAPQGALLSVYNATPGGLVATAYDAGADLTICRVDRPGR